MPDAHGGLRPDIASLPKVPEPEVNGLAITPLARRSNVCGAMRSGDFERETTERLRRSAKAAVIVEFEVCE
jgi:hypothetical protein